MNVHGGSGSDDVPGKMLDASDPLGRAIVYLLLHQFPKKVGGDAEALVAKRIDTVRSSMTFTGSRRHAKLEDRPSFHLLTRIETRWKAASRDGASDSYLEDALSELRFARRRIEVNEHLNVSKAATRPAHG